MSLRTLWAQAPMDRLPARTRAFDVVVAHGIWNLAASAAELRRALIEAERVSRPGAGLFLFTFSRHTLAPDDAPVPGEDFVFTQFAGEPQCFLTEPQILEELGAVGFERDPPGPLTEHNRPRPVAPTAAQSSTRGPSATGANPGAARPAGTTALPSRRTGLSRDAARLLPLAPARA